MYYRRSKIYLLTKGVILFVAAVFLIACSTKGPVEELPKGTDPPMETPPDTKPKYTLTGKVICNGSGVPNVIVTDGFEFSKTDFNGYYYLKSDKKHGYVYLSVPSGYEPIGREGVITPFFKRTTKDKNTEERIDFELKEVNNTDYTLLVMTDAHFINNGDNSGKNDISQASSLLLPELKALAAEHKNAGKPLYGLCLGDMIEDIYWPTFHYTNYLNFMAEVDIPFFHTMGNHEYSVTAAGDWETAKDYKQYLGPTYYSFNLGRVHYIVSDNMICLNPGNGSAREVRGEIDNDQLEWLKKDLSYINKNTPIVLAAHIPIFNETVTNGTVNHSVALSNGSALQTILADYPEVYFLTGHTHINKSAQINNIMELNVAAVSGSWWFTARSGYSDRHICNDGSPGGYQLFDIEGNKVTWQYKGLGQPVDKQFRAYDRNQIHMTAAKYCPNGTTAGKTQFETTYAREYAQASTDNYVYINIWAWDPAWKLEVRENGQVLPYTRIATHDPLKILAYEAVYTDKRLPVQGYASANNSTHFFRVKASNATSTLDIKVTDRFGNVYTESMIRPKMFNINAD